MDLNNTDGDTRSPCLEVEEAKQSWYWNFWKWCPTSMHLLREAEARIYSYLKSPYRGWFVNIGNEIGGGKDNLIWTLAVNEHHKDNFPIVLIHGFGSGTGLWCLNIDALACRRTLYAFDILGFGRSSRPDFKNDPIEAENQFVGSIEKWRTAVGLDQFILVGHSFGGFLGAAYAITYPKRVAHLVLADPWGFPERPLEVANKYNLPFWVRIIGSLFQPFNPLFIIRTAGPLGPKILQRARPDLVRKFSGLVEDAEETIPNYLYHCNAQHPSGESAFHCMLSGFGWAKFPMVHRMTLLKKDVPITLIYGARSWVDTDPGFQIKYMRQESYVNVKVIPSAGHHVYADRARTFNDLVNKIASFTDRGLHPPLNDENIQRILTNESEGFSAFLNTPSDTTRDDSFKSKKENVAADKDVGKKYQTDTDR